MGFVHHGDGSEPSDYLLGDRMYSIISIKQYDSSSKSSYRTGYLASTDNIDAVKFVARTDLARQGGNRIKEANFEFSYQDRHFSLNCQVGWYNSSDEDAKLLEKMPQMCSPNATFRAGDVLISVDQRSSKKNGSQHIPIPPEEWPKQWSYIINKIMSFKINKDKSIDNQ